MARIHGDNADLTINSVALEDELDQIDLEVGQRLAEVTAMADVGEEFVEGKYGWSLEAAGSADFAASQGDATIFGLIGGGEVAAGYEPTGATAGTDDPNYDGNVLLERYRISSRVNQAARYQATFRGNGALTRATS